MVWDEKGYSDLFAGVHVYNKYNARLWRRKIQFLPFQRVVPSAERYVLTVVTMLGDKGSLAPKSPQDSPAFSKVLNPNRKRKRAQEPEYSSPLAQEQPIVKRARTPVTSYAVKEEKTTSDADNRFGHLISHWVKEGSWPEFFKQDPMFLLPRKRKSLASFQDENSEEKINTSCEGGDGTQAARNSDYEQQLATASVHLEENMATIAQDEKDLCISFLNANQPVPKISLFQDSLLESTASRYLYRSEAMVFRDITPLITPSAELLYVFGSTHLAHLREEVDTIWTKCICLASGPRPKPDFAVGLKSSAFTGTELNKLIPYVGGSKETCFFKVTRDVYFPFLTCEAKGGDLGLVVADRQNAHSASIAVNALVQLYKAVSREREISKKILAFSISHNGEAVKIYGHYALVQEGKISYHRYAIHRCHFTALDGKEKWTAYRFTKNLYDKFLPLHLDRVKSAINQLPDPKTFLVSSLTSVASGDALESSDLQEMETINERLKKEINELRDRMNQFIGQIDLLKQALPNAATGIGSEGQGILQRETVMLQQENERQKEQINKLKTRRNQLIGQIDLLKETPTNASTRIGSEGQETLEKEKGMRQQRIDHLEEQLKQGEGTMAMKEHEGPGSE